MPGSNDLRQLDRSTSGDRVRVVRLADNAAAAVSPGDQDAMFLVTPAAGNVIQPLPVIATVGTGFRFTVKNINAANLVTLTPNLVAGDLIDDGATADLASKEANTLVSEVVDGAPDQWRVASNNG